MTPPLENLGTVAVALRHIPERFVFAGAGILPFFLDSTFHGKVGQTDDTDIVVSVVQYSEWSRLRDELIAHGFRERADDRESRQILFWFDGLEVDFIPARMREFGTENIWLSLGWSHAEPEELANGEIIWRLPFNAWLASKIAAFEQRGRLDVLMSRDLEDIVTALIGRASAVDDVRESPPTIRNFITNAFRAWRSQPLIWDAMDGYAASREELLSLDAARCALAAS